MLSFITGAGGFFFDGWPGKIALIFVGFLGLVGWWQLDRSHQFELGSANGKSELTTASVETWKQALEAGRAADELGAIDRLRVHSCRDC